MVWYGMSLRTKTSGCKYRNSVKYKNKNSVIVRFLLPCLCVCSVIFCALQNTKSLISAWRNGQFFVWDGRVTQCTQKNTRIHAQVSLQISKTILKTVCYFDLIHNFKKSKIVAKVDLKIKVVSQFYRTNHYLPNNDGRK